MGASQVPAAGASNPSDNWQLISSVSGSGSTVTFSSISGYKKLMLRGVGLSTVSGSNGAWIVTINGDTAAKYDYAYNYTNPVNADKYDVISTTGTTAIGFPSSFASSGDLSLTINNTDTTGIKTLSGFLGGTNVSSQTYASSNLVGNYLAAASVSSVSINVSTSTILGTLSLYGVSA